MHAKNYCVNSQPIDIYADAAKVQYHFVTQLDTTIVQSREPLDSVGLYLKTQNGYDGSIAPKLIAFNASFDLTPIYYF